MLATAGLPAAKVREEDALSGSGRTDWCEIMELRIAPLQNPVPFLVVGRAEPNHVEMAPVIVMVGMNEVRPPAAHAWLFRQPAAYQRVLDRLMGAALFWICGLPASAIALPGGSDTLGGAAKTHHPPPLFPGACASTV